MWNIATKLFWISRPISWPNTAFPFGAAYILSGGQVDVTFVVGTLFFLIPYNLLMYGINDVFDYESDIKNPRKGGIEGMREQRAFHPVIVRSSLIAAFPFTVFFLLQGSVIARLIFLSLIFFVLAYSVKYLRFKERPVLDSITSSIHFVGPLVYALSLMNFPVAAWPYVLAFFLWGMASHAFGAVQDIVPDRAGNINSIATVLGASRTVWFSAILYMAAAIIVIVQGFPELLVGIVGLAYLFNVLPYVFVEDAQSVKTHAGWRHFLILNYMTGFIVTMVLIYLSLTR